MKVLASILFVILLIALLYLFIKLTIKKEGNHKNLAIIFTLFIVESLLACYIQMGFDFIVSISNHVESSESEIIDGDQEESTDKIDGYIMSYINEAKDQLNDNDPDVALEIIQNALKEYPDSELLREEEQIYRDLIKEKAIEDAIGEAELYANSKKYLSAINMLDSVQLIYGSNSTLAARRSDYQELYVTDICGRADTYLDSYNVEQAERIVNEALKHFPDSQELQDELGKITLYDSLNPQYADVIEKEDNDSSQNAQKVTLGGSIKGTIAPEKDVDYYKFTIIHSGNVCLQMLSYMRFYTIVILDSSGNHVWHSDGNEYNSTVGFRKDEHYIDIESGTYYIKVTGNKWSDGSGSNATGDYTISTAFANAGANEIEPNNNASEANSVNPGDNLKGVIASNDKYDFYVFTLQTPGRLELDVVSYMRFYTLILYDTSGNQLWRTDGNEYNLTVGFREDNYYIDLECGTFFLKVTGNKWSDESGSNSTGNYIIQTSFTDSNSNEIEPNNTATTANSIDIKNEIRGLIASNDRYDFFEFELFSSRNVEIYFTSHMNYYTIVLYDSSGSRIWYSDGNEINSLIGLREDRHEVSLNQGAYYIKVMGNRWSDESGSNSTGKYSFIIS